MQGNKSDRGYPKIFASPRKEKLIRIIHLFFLFFLTYPFVLICQFFIKIILYFFSIFVCFLLNYLYDLRFLSISAFPIKTKIEKKI